MDGEDGKKIQLNYHCFNIEISFISLMLAETKFITLLHSGKVQGGALGAGMRRPGDVSRVLFSLPVHGALLTDFPPRTASFLSPSFNRPNATASCFVTKANPRTKRRVQREERKGKKNRQ